MFNALIHRQFLAVNKRYIPVLLNLPYCDSAVIRNLPKLKEVIRGGDFCRNVVHKFKGNFIENLFINKFEETVLEYPEMESLEEVDVLKEHYSLARNLITGLCEKKDIVPFGAESRDPVATLKNLELTGFKLPRIKRGFGYLLSEFTFLQEALGLDPALSKTVSEFENFGIHLINLYGSEEQKRLYLEKLVTGEITACFAHIESGNFVSFETDSLNTTALLSSDTQSYVISGTKNWVYNAQNANLVIFLANVISNSEEKELKPTLFLIDKKTPGVEISEPVQTVGIKSLKISDVTFNSVVVPESSVLGNIGEGDEMFKKVLVQGKLSNGGHCLPIMRQFINKAIQHCIHNEFFRKDKYECEYFKCKIGKIIAQMYGVESMTYLLTGRVDSHKDADVFLESLIIKIFASESLQIIMQECIEILGSDFFKNDGLFELSRDSQFYAACDDSNDCLRLTLSSAGVRHAIRSKNERSFLEVVKNLFDRQNIRSFFLKEHYYSAKNILEGYLHPTFEAESKGIEDSVLILSQCTKHLIKTYGENVFERHMELHYLADIVINIYAMIATLARASRAYCLAVRYHELDRVCAECVTRLAVLRVRDARSCILHNKSDHPNFREIGSHLMDSKFSQLYPVIRNLTAKN